MRVPTITARGPVKISRSRCWTREPGPSIGDWNCYVLASHSMEPTPVSERPRGMTFLVRLGLASVCFGLLTACAAQTPTPERSPQVDVVITRVDDSRVPYPTARVEGRLSLENGCLIINDAVAFWPAGTTWDAEKQAVVFGGDFRGAPQVAVNAEFSGGGGRWGAEDDFSQVVDGAAEEALRNCMRSTSIMSAVLAYPDN